MAVQRIRLLSVPIDCLSFENLEETIMDFTQKQGGKQICFINVWDLLKARCSKEFMACLKNADLVLPTSKSIIRAANFLKLLEPKRYNPFSTIITILGTLERHYKSLYLLGSQKDSLMTTERNLKSTFPGLQIVGRYVGYYPKNIEKNVVEAIRKASPTMVLISDGINGGNLWSYRKRQQFDSSIMLYSKDIFKIFSKQKKRVSNEVFEKGGEIWQEIIRNPLKIFLIFPFIWFNILLLWYKIFKRNLQ